MSKQGYRPFLYKDYFPMEQFLIFAIVHVILELGFSLCKCVWCQSGKEWQNGWIVNGSCYVGCYLCPPMVVLSSLYVLGLFKSCLINSLFISMCILRDLPRQKNPRPLRLRELPWFYMFPCSYENISFLPNVKEARK